MIPKKSPARCRLLETASRLFQKRGYSEVGIDEIIEESQTAKATFYRHFPSKEKLVEAWLCAIHDNSEERQEKIINAEGCPVQKIANAFDGLSDYMIAHDFRGCPYSNSCAVTESGNELIRQQIERHKESTRQFFHRISQCILEVRNEANLLGDRIFILYSGATTEAQNLRDLWPIETAKGAALDLCEMAKSPAA